MEVPQYPPPENELSLKDLLRLVQDYLRHFWAKKWWIVLGGILIAGFFAWRAYRTPTTYTAELTFMVNEDDGGGAGVASILGQFGFGGSGSSSEFNLDKIVALGKSRRIMQTVLFDRVSWQEEEDYLANHLIEYLELPEAWAKSDNPDMQDFRFTRDSIPAFTRTESSVMKSLHGRLVGSTENPGLVRIEYDPQTSILGIKTQAEDEELATLITEALYAELSRYYIEKSTAKQQATVDVLQSRADSVRDALNRSEYQLASLQDNTKGFQLQKDRLRENRLQRDVQVLVLAYGEVLKNLETSTFLLKNKTPFFQMIDPPLPPLPRRSGNFIREGIKGGIIGVVLAVALLAGIKFLREQLAEEEEEGPAEPV